MTEHMTYLVRGLSLAALLMAGSCAAPDTGANGVFLDGAVNHPIAVEPSYQSLKLTYAYSGLSVAEEQRLQTFVGDYINHGNGSIAVSVPAGTGASAAISWFAEHIAAMGIDRTRIIVAQHDAPAGDTRVELNYVAYQASVGKCGDWSEDLSKTLDNSTSRNFGCAVQQNIAAMIADPRDLLGPRNMDPIDAKRRAIMVDHYEKGEITQADKHTSDKAVEQSAGASQVGQ